MAEHCIIINVDEYNELVRMAERIAAVERLVNSGEYVSDKNILTVLGIEKKKDGDNLEK